MVVNLKTFLLTGEFGSVRFDMTRQQLEDLLGAPEMWGSQDNKWQAEIWKYGSFEFYFPKAKYSDKFGLFMIFADDFHNSLRGNQTLIIDPWILNAQLTLSSLEAILQHEQIAYTPTKRIGDELSKHITFPSGVVVSFGPNINGNNDNDLSLQAITFIQNEAQRTEHKAKHYQVEATKQISVILSLSDYEKVRRISLKRKETVTMICSQWLKDYIQKLPDDAE